MPYCPTCKAEYIDGMSRCDDCEKDLVDELPETEDGTRVVDNDTVFVALRSYATVMHAEMVAEVLKNAGIPTMIRSNEMFGAGTGMGMLSAPCVQVFVPDEYEQEARDIADSTIDPLKG